MYNPVLYELMKVENKDYKMMREAIAKRSRHKDFQKDLRIHGFSKIVSYVSVAFIAYIFIIEQLGQNNDTSQFLKIFDLIIKSKGIVILIAIIATVVRFIYAKKMQEHYKVINEYFYKDSIKERRLSFPLVSASAKDIVLSLDGSEFNVPTSLILNKEEYMSKVELEFEQYLLPVFQVTPKNKLKFSGFRMSPNYNKKLR